MKIEIARAGSAFVLRVPSFGGAELWSVRFDAIEPAREMARACADWFPGCTITDETGSALPAGPRQPVRA